MSTSYKHFTSLGVALFVSGPSGAGKTTVCDKLLAERGNIHFSISCTTRAPRQGEVHGVDYYFISAEDFEEKVENDEFIEYAEVHDNYYGTLKCEVIDRVMAGQDVLIDIDVQGMKQIKEVMQRNDVLRKASAFVFIAPPSFNELEKRLRQRNTESETVIAKRLLNARKELKAWKDYTYLIINDKVDNAVARLKAVMDAVSIRTERLEPLKEWPYV